MSYQFIREICGEFAALFYELKQELQAVESAAALRGFEKKLKERLPELAEREQRKIRLMVSRRWNTI
jgi:hypothetical protein